MSSKDSLEAMKDQDLHAAGVKHTDAAKGEKIHGHEHTKPEGDLRQVELKEEGRTAQPRGFPTNKN